MASSNNCNIQHIVAAGLARRWKFKKRNWNSRYFCTICTRFKQKPCVGVCVSVCAQWMLKRVAAKYAKKIIFFNLYSFVDREFYNVGTYFTVIHKRLLNALRYFCVLPHFDSLRLRVIVLSHALSFNFIRILQSTRE